VDGTGSRSFRVADIESTNVETLGSAAMAFASFGGICKHMYICHHQDHLHVAYSEESVTE